MLPSPVCRAGEPDLVIARSTTACTQVDALDWSVPSLVVVTLPVLLTTPLVGQSPPVAPVVGEVMCTVNVLAACVVLCGTVTPFAPPQVNTPAAIAQLPFQPAPCESIVQFRPAFVGNVSFSFTPAASPAPEFQTVIVKPTGSPAFTLEASAIFKTLTSAGLTQTVSSDEWLPSLVVVTWPVLSTTPLPGHAPAVSLVVGETMCTVNVLAACVVLCGTVTPFAPPQVRTPAAIAQLPFQPAPCESIVQFRPAFVGNVSFSFTPAASPAPEFQTVIVKPTGSPAFTLEASAIFKTLTSAGLTQTVSSDEGLPSLVVVTWPVLSTTPLPGHAPAVSLVVGETMCTVNVLAACVVLCGTVTPFAPPQVRTPAAIAQLPFQPAPCESIVQFRPAFVGNVSFSFTPAASPAPEFQTVIVKPTGSAAFTLEVSAIFKTLTSAGLTQTLSSDEGLPSLVVVTWPVLSTTPLPGHAPAVSLVVGETMCTVNVLAACVVLCGTVTPFAPPQVRTPAAIAQLPFQPAPCESIVQFRPAFVGNVSFSFTPAASPAPEFQTVI